VVFVVVESTAHRRVVTSAKQGSGDMRLVSDGVTTGETVVVAPPESLADGTAVSTAKTTP
jgi:multidrug efflux pump subunit AcrA (membrane-fusion protein)